MPNYAAEALKNRLGETHSHDIKSTVADMTLIDLGRIDAINDDGTVDITILGLVNGDFPKLNNVEVIYPYGIGIVDVNNLVVVLVPRTTFPSLNNSIIDPHSGFYGLTGAKALPIVTPDDMFITVGVDKFGNFIAQGNGIKIELSSSYFEISYGGNRYRWNSDGTTENSSSEGNVDTNTEEGNFYYFVYDEDGNALFELSVDNTGKILLNVTEYASRICEINIGNNIISVTDNDDSGKHIYIEDANRDPDDEDDHGNIVSLNEEGIEVTDISDNNITMREEGITISDSNFNPDDDSTHPNQITTTENGIEILDVNDNTITLNSDGIEINDTNDNNVKINSDGIVVTDANDNSITMSSSGTKVKDANGNTVTLDNSGVNIEDANDNSITMSSSGTEIKDASGNTITLDNSGVGIKDATGNKFTLGASGISGTATSLVTIGNSAMTIGSLLQDLATQLSTVVITAPNGACTSTLPAVIQAWAAEVSSVLG